MQVAKDVKVMMALKMASGTWIKAPLEYALTMHCRVTGIYVGFIDFPFNNTMPHISSYPSHILLHSTNTIVLGTGEQMKENCI